jgi:DNA-binding MarR family transcriptional regulator
VFQPTFLSGRAISLLSWGVLPAIISVEFLTWWIVYRFSIIRVVAKMSRSPSDRESDSESLVDAFGRFMPVFKRWLELKYEKGTMTYARLKLVGMLHVKGPMIMSELGARLDVSARNITKLVDALEHEGLVRRVAHCTDRRATVIETTPEGSKVGEQVWGEHRRAMSTLFDELSEGDRVDLLRTVTRLHAVLERRMRDGGLISPPCGEGPRTKNASDDANQE